MRCPGACGSRIRGISWVRRPGSVGVALRGSGAAWRVAGDGAEPAQPVARSRAAGARGPPVAMDEKAPKGGY